MKLIPKNKNISAYVNRSEIREIPEDGWRRGGREFWMESFEINISTHPRNTLLSSRSQRRRFECFTLCVFRTPTHNTTHSVTHLNREKLHTLCSDAISHFPGKLEIIICSCRRCMMAFLSSIRLA